MRGRDTCTLFVPQEAGYTPLVLENVHWQEEIAGGSGVSAQGRVLAKRLVRVYVPLHHLPPDIGQLCGSCYLVRGQAPTPPDGQEVFTLTAAARCQNGSAPLHHWELLAE